MSYKQQLAIIGLGYVGLPIATSFAKKRKVIAFDINSRRIFELKSGYDRTGEVQTLDLQNEQLIFTDNPKDIGQADIFIVTVPTPINNAKQPDFLPLIRASELIGQHLRQGAIVIYESTVYPGATEEVCAPVLEEVSGLKSGIDFFLGYSPERINPGDRDHTFSKIRKVVSGQNKEVLQIVADLYKEVVEAGVYEASSIKVAEAAKVIENTQRDLNIALINELAMIFNTLGINTNEVLAAAQTKWNFLPFKPGLVGGHCIGVDPYYLTHKALMHGFHPEIILAGRRTNDKMGKYIAEQTIKQLIHGGVAVKKARIAILGLTFKENCPDIRNTRVIDILYELNTYGVESIIHDPLAEKDEAQLEYGITLKDYETIGIVDAIILAVPHSFYLEQEITSLISPLKNSFKLLIDVKSVLDHITLQNLGVQTWCL